MQQVMPDGFVRVMELLPSTETDSMRMRFVLKGPKGATQFVIATGMFFAHTRKKVSTHNYPLGMDIGYHSLEPFYPDQLSYSCDILDCGKCYYDGSTINAMEFMDTFLEKGESAVWPMLEDRYQQIFGEPE